MCSQGWGPLLRNGQGFCCVGACVNHGSCLAKQESDGDRLALGCSHLDFSLLRTSVSLLLEQILDASNQDRLIGLVFSWSWSCVSLG